MGRFTRRSIRRLELMGEAAAACRCPHNLRLVSRTDRPAPPICTRCGGLRPAVILADCTRADLCRLRARRFAELEAAARGQDRGPFAARRRLLAEFAAGGRR